MRILREIVQGDLGFETSQDAIKYEVRKAARAVLLDDKGRIALMNVGADGYYKLPGGGLERGETLEEALQREVLEEVGARLVIQDEIGVVLEYRDRFEQLQVSYCYLCRVLGDLAPPNFTEIELNHRFGLIWVKPAQALDRVAAYRGEKYVAQFICARDLTVLQAAIGLLGR